MLAKHEAIIVDQTRSHRDQWRATMEQRRKNKLLLAGYKQNILDFQKMSDHITTSPVDLAITMHQDDSEDFLGIA